jgi:3-hydroxybutyryl-CoA dehydrogenase
MSVIIFKTIGVLGFGKMGSDIFNYISEFDFEIIVLCYDNEELERGRKSYCKRLDRKLRAQLISVEEHSARTNSVIFTLNTEDLSRCDLIIESVTEDISVKKKLFAKVDEIVNGACIIVSNSSSYIPSEIMISEKRKGKIAGLHFFFPLSLKNICELIISSDTSDLTKNSIIAWLSKIDRYYLLLREENAFILNKVFTAMQAEAFNICRETGISYKTIDDIVKKNLFPSGVFEFFDNVGIDIMYASFQNYVKMENDAYHYLPLTEEFLRLISLGKLGVKTKSGFFDYNYKIDDSDFQQIEIDEKTRLEILKKLILRYYQSAKSIVDKKICSAETLEYAVKEYMSIDKGPFLTAAENNINLSD